MGAKLFLNNEQVARLADSGYGLSYDRTKKRPKLRAVRKSMVRYPVHSNHCK